RLVTLWTSYNPRCFRINFKLVHTNIVIRNRSACHLGKVNFKVFFICVFNRLLAIVSTVNSECVDFICQRVIFDKVLTHSDAQFGEDFVKDHPLANEIDTLAVYGAYYRQETVKHADKKDLEINFSQMTGRSVSDDYIGVDQFEIDPETSNVIRCPQGYEPTLSIYDSEKEIYTAEFYKEH